MTEITLPSGIKIGEDHPPFIIAEVGSNWSSLEDCMNSISQAKLCGADAVKFQAYNSEALYGNTNKQLSGVLPLEWLPKLKEKADVVGIEFMSSAFSPELIDAVDPYVNIHKLASSEMCHIRMLERLKKIGKPVIISTGAQHPDDIGRVIQFFKTPKETPLVLLYCVAAYPAREVRIEQIYNYQNQFEVLTGFSDHTTDIWVIPRVAVDTGAVVIEKHVNFVAAKGPDAPHSLSGDEFRRMVTSIKGVVDPIIGNTEEKNMILRHKRRLIATRTIYPADKLVEGHNFGIYRSLKDDTHAFSPWLVNEVTGKVAKREIQQGDGIGPGDI